jgi:hypothetical protein
VGAIGFLASVVDFFGTNQTPHVKFARIGLSETQATKDPVFMKSALERALARAAKQH